MNGFGDFDKNMIQLIQLLKKILTGPLPPSQFPEMASLLKDKGINLNFCFFTFLPLTPQELDEFEEIFDHYGLDTDKRSEDLTEELSASDLDFLRRHGIRF